jgi:hypothetical protein
MNAWICRTCGTQFSPSASPPLACPICEDERQYVGYGGQLWTSMEELRAAHANRIETVEPGLTGIGSEPPFAINQRALRLRSDLRRVVGACGGEQRARGD